VKGTPEELIKRYERLAGERLTFEVTWQDVIDNVSPHRTNVIGSDTPGSVRSIQIYDSTAVKANTRLAAALNSMLTNQSSAWFILETDDEDLNEDSEVKLWLEEVTDETRKSLANSNFYTQAHEMYLDLGSIGTGVLFIEESKEEDKDLNFSARHIREIYVAEDYQGMVDLVIRKFTMTARQMVDRWESTVSEDVTKQLKDNPDKEFEILHCVFPREETDPEKIDNLNMSFASVWVEFEEQHKLEEGGFEEFPYIVPRWLKDSGEKYGRSPAIDALPDIKMVNSMMETMIKTGQKIADPPLQVPDEGFLNEVSLTPGSITYYRAGTRDRIEPLVIGANMPITAQMIQEKRDSIGDAFFATQLQIIDQREMTAEEVRARSQENMRVLGPTFGRLQTEFLEKLIFRVINILSNATDTEGNPKLPIPPASVQGKNFKLKFVSPLAKAQQISELQSINMTVQSAMGMAQADPSVLDNINFDMVVRKVADLDGAPMDILRTEEEVAAIRQMRQQIQQQQMQMEMAQQGAGVAKDMSQAQSNTQEG